MFASVTPPVGTETKRRQRLLSRNISSDPSVKRARVYPRICLPLRPGNVGEMGATERETDRAEKLCGEEIRREGAVRRLIGSAAVLSEPAHLHTVNPPGFLFISVDRSACHQSPASRRTGLR
ncbi:hypothetical protein DPEC_G00326880 [Dallia pectoralis]|uniref:Uncharacterized protein n=1 Tax=Dallia pectoralis TaxID=75939 RepID=A0ACC2F7Y4_DALPE|nr:hypothetical protein DPEC_G00326880 [Dallia pectoralis]